MKMTTSPARALVAAIAVALVTVAEARAADMALIEPAALQATMATWVVLDARPRSAWESGRIPGALSLSWENYTGTDGEGIPFRILPPEELALRLGSMGIDGITPLVIYGDADTSWGGEGWAAWMFAWLGHEGPIRILNGGVDAWRRGGFAVTTGAPTARGRARYVPRPAPEWDIATAEILRPRTPIILIDTRSTMEWLVDAIPGAVHIEWAKFHTGDERRPLGRDALVRLLRDHGVDPRKPVVYYCRGGVRSGYAWMVHQLAGLPDARNYEGGMEMWWKHSAR
ncbi:MAG: hypothetical protein HQK87_01565 [Nitrospinae bacterium]|nr:hypothetical protein [Nitrospinota bacterium]